MKIPRIMYSNLWPVAAYGTMATWLFVINHQTLGFHWGWSDWQFAMLSQLDSVAHFSTALALASNYTALLGRKRTIIWLLVASVAWEIFEYFTQPAFAGAIIDAVYWADMLDDLALDIAGILIGTHFANHEPLNIGKAY